MMGAEVVEVITFEQRMMGRIKESIGDMITDDELSKIVSKGVHQAFFEPHYAKDQWGSIKVNNEPLITGILKKCMADRVEEEVKAWFADNPDELKNLLDSAIRDGLTGIVLKAFDSKLQNSLFNFGQQLQEQIQAYFNR